MGSNEEIPQTHEEEITFLVTGFAPFREQYPVNPSWEIARALPPFLPPTKSFSPQDPPVRILVYPSAIHVRYKAVRELVPKLWDHTSDAEKQGKRRIDYAIHIGMASGRKYYSVERKAHRDGYEICDVDGEMLGDEKRRAEEGRDWIWSGLPRELYSAVDVEDVWARWRIGCPDSDVRISEDAGRYLCDFIYYSSLAELARRGEEKRVLFFHVPVEDDKASIEKGVDITLGLIRAVVSSERLRKEFLELDQEL